MQVNLALGFISGAQHDHNHNMFQKVFRFPSRTWLSFYNRDIYDNMKSKFTVHAQWVGTLDFFNVICC